MLNNLVLWMRNQAREACAGAKAQGRVRSTASLGSMLLTAVLFALSASEPQ